MGKVKDSIAILMAVYEPKMDWLCEQLDSLNAQTYPRLKLYIRDDCSPSVPFGEIEQCVREHIRAFPYELRRNERNLGSNATFEQLTTEAEGEYFAYCDQDDVWLPEKLAVLHTAIEQQQAELVCSDMYIINGSGIQTADSITKIRRHHRFRSGDDLAKELLVSNFVTGCTMLIRSEIARASIPFCPYMVHDHYLALCAAGAGTIISLPERLIRYRVHGGNQTGLMAGVQDKNSYGAVRIGRLLDRLVWLRDSARFTGETAASIDAAIVWARARKMNWEHGGSRKTVWKYRHFSLLPSLFELAAARMPESVFQVFLTLAKRNAV